MLTSYTVRQAHVEAVRQTQGGPDDADGNRVTAVIGSSTTVYIGADHEKMTFGSSTTITKYDQIGHVPTLQRKRQRVTRTPVTDASATD